MTFAKNILLDLLSNFLGRTEETAFVRSLTQHLSLIWNTKTLVLLFLADEDIASVDSATLKQAYAALVTLILEAVKVDYDIASLRYSIY